VAAVTAKGLLRAIESLPDEATVPVGWVRDQIGAGEPVEVDLTIEEFASMLERKASTVRGWMPIEGAYKFRGREWRIPHDAARRYLERQRAGNGGSH